MSPTTRQNVSFVIICVNDDPSDQPMVSKPTLATSIFHRYSIEETINASVIQNRHISRSKSSLIEHILFVVENKHSNEYSKYKLKTRLRLRILGNIHIDKNSHSAQTNIFLQGTEQLIKLKTTLLLRYFMTRIAKLKYFN